MSPQEVAELIRQGENESIEFKELPVRPGVGHVLVVFGCRFGLSKGIDAMKDLM